MVLEGKHTHTHLLPTPSSLHTPTNSQVTTSKRVCVCEQQIVPNFKSLAITGANILLIKEVKWRER